MSSALGLEPGSDWQASGLLVLSPEKSGGNRAGSLGVRVGNERQRPRLAAPRWQQPHLRTGGDSHCEADRGRSRSGAKAKRIAWWERRGSGGLREQEASRRSGVQLPAAVCASTRRGKRERNGKGEGWTCGPVAKYTEKPAERPASIKKSAFGTTLSRSRGSYKSAERILYSAGHARNGIRADCV